MTKIKSDGGSSSYYEIDIPINKVSLIDFNTGEAWTDVEYSPVIAVKLEVKDVIRYALDNDFDKGNIFKALVRLGKKDGASAEYDINKCAFFLEELRKEHVHD
jgi:hypothetical protein